MKKITYILFLSLYAFMACDNASEDDLTEPIVIEPNVFVTYDANVKSIIDNNCISCHNNPPINGASTSLVTYNDVKTSVESINLINRISAQAGDAGAMPLGGPRLPQNFIDIVVQWQADGLLEN
ncbi:hypothetical protein [Pontimicrobium sp. MEBiC01747]|jgi:uncharacterized membrane protein